jgi:5-methylcytosine-specific restriction protein A
VTLSDVTDPDAVLAAMAEYDEVGGEAFRARYGFRVSRYYELEHEGRTYDSKAIVAVAHGKQHPERGPLRPKELRGGANGAAGRLERLGFTVVNPAPNGNPDWTADELILALEVYLRKAPALPAAMDPDVVELSVLLRQLAPQIVEGVPTYRNLNGVHRQGREQGRPRYRGGLGHLERATPGATRSRDGDQSGHHVRRRHP